MTKKEFKKINVLLIYKSRYEKQLKLINSNHSIYITTRNLDGSMSNEYLFSDDDEKALKKYCKDKINDCHKQLKELGYYD